MRDVERVNALASGKTLSFSASGVTVVYGDNASGKSGYARVLKKVCRARGSSPRILPNVFEAAPATGPAATIDFRLGANESTYKWTDGAASPPALSQISVFDSDAASVYVEEKTDIAFRPFGLDIFPKLVSICDQLKWRLQAEIASLGGAAAFPELHQDTSVGDLLRTLTRDDSPERLGRLASLTERELRRLEELRGLIAELDARDPARRAGEIRNRARRYRLLADHLSAVARLVAPSRIEELRRLGAERSAALAAARVVRAEAVGDDPRWGVGEALWMVLWDAARRYSQEVVYPSEDFPVTREGAECVLCQQPLSGDARARLARFEAFVRQEAQRRATAATAALDEVRTVLRATQVRRSQDAAVLQEIALEDGSLESDIQAILRGLEGAFALAIRAMDDNSWDAIPVVDEEAAQRLLAACSAIERSASELDSAQAPTEAVKLRHELSELSDREKLSGLAARIESERNRQLRLAALMECVKQTDTTGITAKNTELTKAGVSEELREGFEKELNKLHLQDLTVSVHPQYGAKGVAYHQVEFDGAKTHGWGVREVLSEGEYRCIALAAFFAELSMQAGKSSAILDDPISSLDHARRELVANRVVSEAVHRPMIVLTHDIVFVLLVQEEAERQGVPFTGRFLSRERGDLGIPVDGLPWYGMSLKKRLGWLKQEAVKLKKVHDTGTQEQYERDAAFLWGRLREAWECGVEEVLLGGAVKRFSRNVSTQPLRKVHDITKADVDEVEAAMTACSTWLPGHDLSPAMNVPMPAPGVLSAAIESLDTWRAGIEKRRN